MASDPIDLDSYFPFFLGTLSNRWTATSSRIYLDRFGVGIGEWRVLASIPGLGAASPQQIVGVISMEEGGFVRKVAGRFVGRTKPYEMTDEGRDLYVAMRDVALARENELLGALSAEERAQLIELMRKVMARIGDL